MSWGSQDPDVTQLYGIQRAKTREADTTLYLGLGERAESWQQVVALTPYKVLPLPMRWKTMV